MNQQKKNLVIGGVSLGAAAIALFFWKKSQGIQRKSIGDKLKNLFEQLIQDGLSAEEFAVRVGNIHNEFILKKIMKISQNYYQKDKNIIYYYNNDKHRSCNKIFKSTDPKYFCIDCQSDNVIRDKINVVCEGCFNKSDHKGHQVMSAQPQDICVQSCTCGDPNFIDKKGFCTEHIGTEDLQIPQVIKDSLKLDFDTFWGHLFFNILYNVENAVELNLDQNAKESLGCIFQNVLENLQKQCKNTLFLNLLGDLLMQQIVDNQMLISHDKNATKFDFRLLHDCKNLEQIQYLNDFQRENQDCNCTYMENLIRFVPYYKIQITQQLSQLILLLRPIQKFSEYMSGLIPQQINFIYHFDRSAITKDIKFHSNSMIAIIDRFTMPEKNGQIMINSPYFKNIAKCFDQLLTCYTESLQNEYNYASSSLFFIFRLLASQKQVCLNMIKQKDFIENIFHIMEKIEKRAIAEFTFLSEFQKYFTDQIPLINLLGVSGIGCLQILDSMLISLKSLEKQERQTILKRISQIFINHFNELIKIRQQQTNSEQKHYNIICLTQSFSLVMLRLLAHEEKELNQNNVQYILSEYFLLKEKQDQLKFFQDFCQVLEKCQFSSMSREFLNQIRSFQYLSQKLLDGYEKFEQTVLDAKNMLQDTLILSWQISFLACPEVITKFVIEPFTKTLYTNVSQGQVIHANLLKLNLMFLSESSWANIEAKLFPKSEKIQQVCEQTLITFFQTQGQYVSMKEIKDNILMLFPENIKLEDILPKVADFDKKQRKFTLKKEKEKQGKILNIELCSQNNKMKDRLKEKVTMKKDFDQFLISHQQNQRQNYIEEINQNLYSNTQMIDIFDYIFNQKAQNFEETCQTILSDQFLFLLEGLIDTVEETMLIDDTYYIKFIKNQNLEQFLRFVKKRDSKSDYLEAAQSLLERITNIQKQVQGIQFVKHESSMQETNLIKNAEEEKKRKIKERQEKMMKKFQDKRNKFQLDKQLSLKQSDSVIPGQQLNSQSCIMCHEAIKIDSQNICYPVYIKQTNLNQYAIQNSMDKPYVAYSSCGHLYHQTCWTSYIEKNQIKLPNVDFLFRNKHEVWCSFCKQLSNHWFPYQPECHDTQIRQIDEDNSSLVQVQDLQAVFQKNYSIFGKKDIQKGDDLIKSVINFITVYTESAQKVEHNLLKGLLKDYGTIQIKQNFMKDFKHDGKSEIIFDKVFDSIILNPMRHLEQCDLEEFMGNQGQIFKSFLKTPKIIKFLVPQLYLNCLEIQKDKYEESWEQLGLSELEQKYYQEPMYKIIKLLLLNFIMGYHSDSKIEYLNFSYSLVQAAIISKLKKSGYKQICEENFLEIEQILKYFCFLLSVFDFLSLQIISKTDFTLLKGYTGLFEELFKQNLMTNVDDALKTNQNDKYYEEIFNWDLVNIINSNTLQSDDIQEIQEKEEEENQIKKKQQNQLTILNLPKSYSDFSKKFSDKKCQKCNQITFQQSSSKNKLLTGIAICLLCEQSFCKTFCGNNGEIPIDAQMKTGNLNQHAHDHHNGACLFIETKIPNIVYIHYPFNIILRPLYTNDFGEEISQDRTDWNNFYVDSQMLDELKRQLFHNQIPTTIVTKINYHEDPTKTYYKDYLL